MAVTVRSPQIDRSPCFGLPRNGDSLIVHAKFVIVAGKPQSRLYQLLVTELNTNSAATPKP